MLTSMKCTLVTAYRLPYEPVEVGGAPIGRQCRRRRLQHQTRHLLIIFAANSPSAFHLANYLLLLEVSAKICR
jgi:hypothetical protein